MDLKCLLKCRQQVECGLQSNVINHEKKKRNPMFWVLFSFGLCFTVISAHEIYINQRIEIDKSDFIIESTLPEN